MNDKTKKQLDSLTKKHNENKQKLDELVNILNDDTKAQHALALQILEEYKHPSKRPALSILRFDEPDYAIPETLTTPAEPEQPAADRVKDELKENLATQLQGLSDQICPINHNLEQIKQQLKKLSDAVMHHGVLDYYAFSTLLQLVRETGWANLISSLYFAICSNQIDNDELLLHFMNSLDGEYDKGYEQRKQDEEDTFQSKLKHKLKEQENSLRSEFKNREEYWKQQVQTAREQGMMEAFETAYDMIKREEGTPRIELETIFCQALRDVED